MPEIAIVTEASSTILADMVLSVSLNRDIAQRGAERILIQNARRVCPREFDYPAMQVRPFFWNTRERLAQRARRIVNARILPSLLAFALVEIVSLASLGVVAGGWGRAAVAHGGPQRAQPAPPAFSHDLMDTLRVDAAMGNSGARIQLAIGLLDQYDRTGDKDPLYEAVQWLDRDWYAPGEEQQRLLARVYDQYCDGKVLRWHPLCILAE